MAVLDKTQLDNKNLYLLRKQIYNSLWNKVTQLDNKNLYLLRKQIYNSLWNKVTEWHNNSNVIVTGICMQRPFMYQETSIMCIWSNSTLQHETDR